MDSQFRHPYVGSVEVELIERTSPGVVVLTVSEADARLMEYGLTLSRLLVDEREKLGRLGDEEIPGAWIQGMFWAADGRPRFVVCHK